jgi:alpha-beta hydrolase superfamily lysophospholipase
VNEGLSELTPLSVQEGIMNSPDSSHSPIRSSRPWRHRFVRLTVALVLVGFVVFNAIAYNQAYTMTHFSEGGVRTRKPEVQKGMAKFKVLLSGVNIPRPVNRSTPSDFGMQYDVHRIAVGRKVVLEAWYVPQEDAKGLVMLFHGYDSCKDKLLPEARAFHDLGYSTMLVDFRGSGGSNQRVTTIGFVEANDVAKSVEYARNLKEADQPLILYGDSMGAAAVLRAIAVYNVRPDGIVIEGVFDRLLSAVRNRFNSMGVPSFPAAELLVFWGGVQFGYNGFGHNPADYAAKVRCPVLMLHGENDPRTPLEQARIVYNKLAGRKSFESFPGVKHTSCFAADPVRWESVVGRFLAECASGETHPRSMN